MATGSATIEIRCVGAAKVCRDIDVVVARLRGLWLATLPAWRAWRLRLWWRIRGLEVIP